MTYRPSHAPRRAIRNILRNFGIRNKAETADIPIERLAKAMRADLQNTRPDLSDAEIERRIERRLSHGLRPTTAEPLAHPIPTKRPGGKPRRKKGGKQ